MAETSSFQHIHDFFVVQKVFCIHGIWRNLYSLQLVIWFHNVHTITDFGLLNSEHEVYVFLLLVTSEVYMTCSILDMFSKIIPKLPFGFSIRCWVDPIWKCWRHGPTGRGENHWSREEHHSAETVRGKAPLMLKVKYQVLSEGGFHSVILNSITGVSNLIRLRSSYSS